MSLLLSSTLVSSLALGAASAPEAPGWAQVLSPFVKVRPGANVQGAPRATLFAGKGECEGFQIYAKPPLQNVQARSAPLLGANGASLTPVLFREEFVRVTTPSNMEGATGLWPDPLLPVMAEGKPLARALPAASTAERPVVLYVEVCVPEKTVVGTYRGNLTLTADAQPNVTVPVSMDVRPFVIPATSSLPNTFGISMYTLAHGHGLSGDSPEALRLMHAYVDLMLTHRLSAHGMSVTPPGVKRENGALQFDFRAYDAELGPYLEGKALPNGARFTAVDVREQGKHLTDEERPAYFRAFREHFAQKGWTVPLFYYAKDEPKPKDFPTVLAQAQRVHAAGGLSVLVTSALNATLQPSTDIFCPVLNCFFERSGPETCTNVQSAESLRARLPPSAHVWWYQSCLSHGCGHEKPAPLKVQKAFAGWASYMVDHPTTLNRAMGPLAYLSGVEGELYFDVAAAYDGAGKPWESVYAFGGNGDGTFFYPGTPAELGTTNHVPVASLRLKTLRDGLEDFEYLKLFEKARGKDAAARKVREWVRSGYDITRDASAWEKTRADIAAELSAAAAKKP